MDYKKRQGGGGSGQGQPHWKQGGQQQSYNNNRGGGNPYHKGAQRSNVSSTNKTQINLITNNFKIKSKKEQGVIYTYKVDFLEGSGPGGVSGGASGFEGGAT